jgi:hypothetical protein
MVPNAFPGNLSGSRLSSNTSYLVSATATVSWSVTFVPAAGSNVAGSTHCETSAVTVTN